MARKKKTSKKMAKAPLDSQQTMTEIIDDFEQEQKERDYKPFPVPADAFIAIWQTSETIEEVIELCTLHAEKNGKDAEGLDENKVKSKASALKAQAKKQGKELNLRSFAGQRGRSSTVNWDQLVLISKDEDAQKKLVASIKRKR